MGPGQLHWDGGGNYSTMLERKGNEISNGLQ